MTDFLLDTHVWLWHLFTDPALAPRARRLIDDSVEECWLSPVSIWEAGTLHRKGKIELHDDFRSWVEEARRKLPLRVAPMTDEVALASFEMDLPHQDPGDRFLAATSRVFDLTLVTADRRLLDSPSVKTLSARN